MIMPLQQMSLPTYILHLLDIFNEHGYEAYVVGGAVRDTVMGVVPHDYDLTTNASPDKVVALFEREFEVIPTGIKHGTVTVVCYDHPVEITTYRIDGKYDENRHPKKVSFAQNVKEDLKRRDFTVNSLVYHPKTGIVDLFGGVEDIHNKVLRCIGEPDKRFTEDALRILRALRFSVTLDFDLEKLTSQSMLKNKDWLTHISKERIQDELLKMFQTNHPKRLSEVLIQFEPIMKTIFPNMQVSQNDYLKICRQLGMIRNTEMLRFMFFLAASGPLTDMLKDLYMSKAFKKKIKAVMEILLKMPNVYEDAAVSRIIYRYGKEATIAAGKILKDLKINIDMLAISEKLIDEKACLELKDLAVNGKDLLALHIPPKDIGLMLENLLFAVMDKKTTNEKTALIKTLYQIDTNIM